MLEAITNFLGTTGIAKLIETPNWWQYLVMYVIIGALFYLAIVKKFEPLLLLPIAFGMLLANLPGANLIHLDYFFDDYYFTQSSGAAPLQLQINEFLKALADAGKSVSEIEKVLLVGGSTRIPAVQEAVKKV